MNNLTFNIGLNVGQNEPTNQLSMTINMLLMSFRINDIKIVSGTYECPKDGTIYERTLIVQATSPSQSIRSIISTIGMISQELSQDAIAVKINNVGHLIYRSDWDNVQPAFDEKYFNNL